MPPDGTEPGPRLARGRTAIVYDLGNGLVLRRHRDAAADVTVEAAAMRWAARFGVPVPHVARAAGPDLVLEHVRGPSMLTVLLADPGQAPAHGRMLADLHRRLDRVPAPARLGLPTAGRQADRLLHRDLHPDNVLLPATGPVLIDWTNAASGPRAVDTATTWLVLACMEQADPEMDVLPAAARRPLLQAFLEGIDRSAAAAAMPIAVAARLTDPATTDPERERIEAFAAGLLRDHGG